MEKINNIKIKNFKSLRDVEINDCRRVNVFIGYPNVGKSNILEALGVYSLYNSFLSTNNLLSKNEVEYGGVTVKNLKNLFRVEDTSEIFYLNQIGNNIAIELNNVCKATMYSSKFDFVIEFKSLLAKNKNEVGEKVEFSTKDLSIKSLNVHISQKSEYPNISIKKYEFTPNVQLENVNDSVLTYPNGENLLNILEQDSLLRKEVNDYFRVFGFRVALEKAKQRIVLIKEGNDDTLSIITYNQVADTLRRLVFYKAAIYSNSNSALLFEEPEAHMFPPYISKFAADVMFDKNNNQYFISTHSPFVLNDFMEELDKEELAIYAVGYKKETGETVVHRITDEEMDNIYQYGIDLFFNLENYLKDAV